jgi:predicted DNA repair protein MutK
VVALIVKMDDVGLHLAEKPSKGSQRVGLALVSAMPRLLAAISLVGTLAMLWVGGHIFLVSLYEIGGHDGLLEGTAIGDALHAPYDLLHHWEEEVHHAIGGALGGLVGWLLNTLVSALVGLVVGFVVLYALRAVGVGGHGDEHAAGHVPTGSEGRGGATGSTPADPPSEDSPNR